MGFIEVSFITNDVNSCCLLGNLAEMLFEKTSQIEIKMKKNHCLVDEHMKVFSYPHFG